ncbi:formyltransferase family protein [Haladaptatus sp. DYF46]|uniref:formyltransferase family protein n=1 Tax=Haladaptatus sp. DYF46 TaxID=2886041 RepID=UPI001E5705B8|nr:formyltransferase family protein [Haladaptatus sp. DYF46]
MPPKDITSEGCIASNASSKSTGKHRDGSEPPPQEPLSIGILLSGETIPTWQKRAIETMLARTNVEITHLVIRTDTSADNLGDFLLQSFPENLITYIQCCYDRLQAHVLWSLLGVVRQLAPTPDYMKPTRIGSIPGFEDAKQIHCPAVPTSGFGNHLPDQVTEDVGANADVVIRFGFGILTDPLLSMPTHGVLSFHRGNLRSYRGQPGGLWEFLNDEPTAGVTLQRIGESPDGGEIIAEEDVDISSARTWREVERRQIAVCEELLAAGVERLQDPTFEPATPDSLGDLYTIPRGRDVGRYLTKTTLGNLRAIISESDQIRPSGLQE